MKDPKVVRCSDLRHGITRVRWRGEEWTAWAQAPGVSTWWLVRLDEDGAAVYEAVPCRDMQYPDEQLELTGSDDA